MRWYPLGHAGWLVEAGDLRLLFDPLLDDEHHGGVFEVAPPRVVHAAALRPDFLFVSHRHPDHFDVPSLRALAALDPETVVVTPDPLVARAARAVGFRAVREIPPRTRVELDGVRLVTTPSRANDAPIGEGALEWGVAIEHGGAIAWNQVDTIFGSAEEVRAIVAEVRAALGGAELALALARWCPLREVEASLAGAIGFPFDAYFALLEQIAATEARALVPAAAGARHAAAFAAMNQLVYPLDEGRFLDDLRRRAPAIAGLAPALGDALDVTPEGARIVAGAGRALVEPRPGFVDDRDFRPLALPALRDANPRGRDEAAMRAANDAWVERALAPALARTTRGARRFALEIVYPARVDPFTIAVEEGRAALTRAIDPRWDVRNAIAGSTLCDVREGRRTWGDALLAGALRGCSRAYDVDASGARRARLGVLFVYAGLSYDESVTRAVERALLGDAEAGVDACADSGVELGAEASGRSTSC